MDIQFARPRDAVAAADDLQYMFATIASSCSSKTRPCKVLLKPRTFAGFGATTSRTQNASTGSSAAAVKSEVTLQNRRVCNVLALAFMSR
jgi:hypothetical protein